MPETALNLPFDSNEIKEIAVAEFRKRLDQLGPIQGTKEYVRFELDYQVKIRLWRAGETGSGKDTLAWGHVEKGEPHTVVVPGAPERVIESADVSESFVSKDPNTERMERDMPLTIETTDGRGGKIRRKARIKE
jgi:hypothetical protein